MEVNMAEILRRTGMWLTRLGSIENKEKCSFTFCENEADKKLVEIQRSSEERYTTKPKIFLCEHHLEFIMKANLERELVWFFCKNLGYQLILYDGEDSVQPQIV